MYRFGFARYYRVKRVVNDMVRGIYRYVSSLGIAGSKPSQVGLIENGVHLREGRATVIAARHQNFKEGADVVNGDADLVRSFRGDPGSVVDRHLYAEWINRPGLT